MQNVVSMALFLCCFLVFFEGTESSLRELNLSRRSQPKTGLCDALIRPSGYHCSEHVVETEDGYLLGLQRVSSSSRNGGGIQGLPFEIIHHFVLALSSSKLYSYFINYAGGDAWFLNSIGQSLGFILVDQGFDVWVGNVRGTHWSHGHISLTERSKEFWDWSWQELALYDLATMIKHVFSVTNSKVFFVGHSQGTIMALAAFTQPEIVDMVEAAALLCPISYLGHVTSPFVHRLVGLHLDQMIMALGIHQLNFRSDLCVRLVDSFCDREVECGNFLTAITGGNCCFNNSRVDFYLNYEPHPSSAKNLNHLFQMIRKGTFAMYDYGLFGNIRRYGQSNPPAFDIARIPKLLPVWMGYGGTDALADVKDVEHTLQDLKLKPELLYLSSYGHIDFLLSVRAKEDVYDAMIRFFKSSKHAAYL
ncbi:hypothetical protein Sjap_022795 [Stephania japonica]|uniref:Lipase n=1 Tax=Stephania japonica TaxID=461633 RepID=A0AAP0EWQ9_9MAGN